MTYLHAVIKAVTINIRLRVTTALNYNYDIIEYISLVVILSRTTQQIIGGSKRLSFWFLDNFDFFPSDV
jgi:hypothetical protein